ncbi:synaptophysin-like [Rhopilema esculentum]|uniref:synaptophysin-like n=1 Tax=Rhopilema esculentum TaxID=499914 RepID=UPI0031CEB341
MRQSFQFEVLKEPRGFIKVIQVFVAIFAFATCTDFRGELQLKQVCNGTMTHDTGAKFKYPFNTRLQFNVHRCRDWALFPYMRDLSYRSSMEYFVVIGVFCFLYSLGILVYYIVFEEDQASSAAPPAKFSPPVIDFVISVVFVVFWFTGAIACAAAVTGIKSATNMDTIIKNINLCTKSSINNVLCTATKQANYATLDISAVMGFLNIFVWCGNLWFLYKETPWHNPQKTTAATVSGPGGPPPSVQAPAAAI